MGLFGIFGKNTGENLSPSQKDKIIEKTKELIKKEKYNAAWDTLTGDGQFAFDKVWNNYRIEDVFALLTECEDYMDADYYRKRYGDKVRTTEIAYSIQRFNKEYFQNERRKKYVASYKNSKSSQSANSKENLSLTEKINEKLYTQNYEEEIENMKNDGPALYKMGCSFLETKQYKDAVLCFKRAAELNNTQALLKCLEMTFEGQMEADSKLCAVWMDKLAESSTIPDEKRLWLQLACGENLLSGRIVRKNVEKAVFWYRQAAENGSADAMYALACIYRDQEEVRNINKSFFWMENAARSNNASAFLPLADMYTDGKATPQDKSKAIEWLNKAAGNGDAEAMYKMSLMLLNYESDNNEFKDLGAKYMILAADSGHTEACFCLGKICDDRGDYEKALEYYKKAAEQKNIQAMLAAVILFETGKVENDLPLSLRYNKILAEHPDVPEEFKGQLQFFCGIIYQYGEGEIKKNLREAVYWYKKSAGNGNETAMYNLGKIYLSEKDIKDEDKALYWMERAAEKGNVDAMRICGVLYSQKSTEEDAGKAFKWTKKAAESGDVKAMPLLAVMYSSGLGTTKDKEEGRKLFEKIKQSGNKELIDITADMAAKYGYEF